MPIIAVITSPRKARVGQQTDDRHRGSGCQRRGRGQQRPPEIPKMPTVICQRATQGPAGAKTRNERGCSKARDEEKRRFGDGPSPPAKTRAANWSWIVRDIHLSLTFQFSSTRGFGVLGLLCSRIVHGPLLGFAYRASGLKKSLFGVSIRFGFGIWQPLWLNRRTGPP